MLTLAHDFTQASGRFAALLYKEEIERAFKTKGFSGFDLLDLHDFPGQGTALVGMLDAFWDSKGVVTPQQHHMYCSEVVPLLRFEKAVYTNDEVFNATAEIANFSAGALKRIKPVWKVTDQNGKLWYNGHLQTQDVPVGNGTELGKISFDLSAIKEAVQLTVSVNLEGSRYHNEWAFWVYPQQREKEPGRVVFTTSVKEALLYLNEGKNVLLNPDTAEIKGVEGRFAPVFWSPVHFPDQPGTMGILCDPKHAALQQFPTDFYSNWQWWDLITSSKTMIVDSLPGLTPIVRVIDNFFKNRKMANIVEVRLGQGKLILASIDLSHNLDKRPAARQLRYSLEHYMAGPSFHPAVEINAGQLSYLLKTEIPSLAKQ
jgi:hypothetical protein